MISASDVEAMIERLDPDGPVLMDAWLGRVRPYLADYLERLHEHELATLVRDFRYAKAVGARTIYVYPYGGTRLDVDCFYDFIQLANSGRILNVQAYPCLDVPFTEAPMDEPVDLGNSITDWQTRDLVISDEGGRLCHVPVGGNGAMWVPVHGQRSVQIGFDHPSGRPVEVWIRLDASDHGLQDGAYTHRIGCRLCAPGRYERKELLAKLREIL